MSTEKYIEELEHRNEILEKRVEELESVIERLQERLKSPLSPIVDGGGGGKVIISDGTSWPDYKDAWSYKISDKTLVTWGSTDFGVTGVTGVTGV